MARVEDVEKAHSLALHLDAQREARIRLAAHDATRSTAYAAELKILSELAVLCTAKPAHAILEVAGTLGVGQGKAGRMIEHARRAVELFPRAVELLACGALRQATVELLLWTTTKASEDVQAELGRRVIDQLIDCDAVDARALIVATLLEVEADLDVEAQKERHAQARANRGVWVKQVEDGMARIGAEVDQLAAHGFQLDLDSLCRLQKRADEAAGVERTAEQRRADVLAELPTRHLALLKAFQQGKTAEDLLGADTFDPATSSTAAACSAVLARMCALPIPKPCVLHVHTPMTTVLDLDNRSGWVDGLGPISAHHTRLLRPVAGLRALWVDPKTGVPMGLGDTVHPPGDEPDWNDTEQVLKAAEHFRQRLRDLLQPSVISDEVEPGRFPSIPLARLIKIRDGRCTGPGCNMPASRCEIDHLTPVSEGGVTAAWQLALKSPRCHHARHEGWTAERDETDGSTTWTSPTGGVYTRRSPWRPPPNINGPLPRPSLDRPDGGKKRTFGQDRNSAAADADDSAAPQTETSEQPEPDGPAPWSRPWHTDGPPPF